MIRKTNIGSYKNNIFFKRLVLLNLPPEDYAIFGSGPMAAYGLKKMEHDIDIVARGNAWKKAQEYGKIEKTLSNFGNGIRLFDGGIEIFDQWPPKNRWNIDNLIDKAEVIDGIKFVRLETVLEWKKMTNRPKDLEDIKKIEDFLNLRDKFKQT